ncbi:MAG TPA: serine hydrolase [Gemmatimonas sp.]|nr:serine hydrolase [Gemmatimonas sp.]
MFMFGGVLLAFSAIAAASHGNKAHWQSTEPVAAFGAAPSVAVRRMTVEPLDSARLARAYAEAARLPRLRSLLVQSRGTMVGERYYRGATAATPANIKSASKSVISALVGIALHEKRLRALEQPLSELLPDAARGLDVAKRAITLQDLLTMRAGLQPTSFGNYGAWVSSPNWVRDALRRPMVSPPGHQGGPMLYSTGSTHLMSAALVRATGTSTHEYAQRVLAKPLGFRLRGWTTDPQGIHFGGNEMRMTPREMLAFGTMYLNGGRAPDGTQVVPREWIDSSWVVRTSSPFNGNGYGYGWWHKRLAGHDVHFAWGYGGQFVFIVPDLALVVVTTSDPNAERERGHLDAIYGLLEREIIPAVGGELALVPKALHHCKWRIATPSTDAGGLTAWLRRCA